MVERTPWLALYAHAHDLRALAAEDFWRLSLKEWRALTAPVGAASLDRAAFDALAVRYPDKGTV